MMLSISSCAHLPSARASFLIRFSLLLSVRVLYRVQLTVFVGHTACKHALRLHASLQLRPGSLTGQSVQLLQRPIYHFSFYGSCFWWPSWRTLCLDPEDFLSLFFNKTSVLLHSTFIFVVTFCIKCAVCFFAYGCLSAPAWPAEKTIFLSPNCFCIFLKYQLIQNKPKEIINKDERRNKQKRVQKTIEKSAEPKNDALKRSIKSINLQLGQPRKK